RVVVSGLGVVSPYGTGAKTFWTGLASGTCAIRTLTAIDTEGFRSRIGAEVPADVLASLGPSRRRARADRLAMAAARQALADAETFSARLGLCGPKGTVVMACASGAASLALGFDLIRSGAAPLALCGGVDALTRVCFMGFNALRLLDLEPCRPFDRDRKGMSIGEGAAFVVLEEAGHCRARGGRAYAELRGAGMTTDAHHVTSPEPSADGMVRAIEEALTAAGHAPGDVGYVNAHGTGTPQNDRVQALALARVFGPGRVLLSSTKSLVGHTMAAAGSLEAVASVLTLQHGLVPPTAH